MVPTSALSFQGVTQYFLLFYLVITRFFSFLLLLSLLGEAKEGECSDLGLTQGLHVCIYYI